MTATAKTPIRTLDDFERLRAEQRERAIQRLGPATIAWLVLVPAWSDLLADRARFPTGRRPLDQVVGELEALNWALRRPARPTGVTPEEAVELLVPVLEELDRQQSRDPSPERAAALAELRKALAVDGSELAEAWRTRRDAEGVADVSEEHAPNVVDTLPALPAEKLAGWLNRHLSDATQQVLAAGWARCAREGEPRAAARAMIAAAHRLSPEQVREAVMAIAARVEGTGAAEQTTTAKLAEAAATAGLAPEALRLTGSLDSERLRARTLSSVAAALISTDQAGAAPAVLRKLLDTLFDGQRVDLPAAAFAVDRLVEAGARESADPVLELVDSSLGEHTHRGAEVGALARLAAAGGPGSAQLASAALKAARAEGDPAVRAAALLQVLDTCSVNERPAVLGEALGAARAVVDEADRAHALARLAPNLPPERQAEVLGELIALCSPDQSKFAFWAVESTRGELVEQIVAELGSRLLDICGEMGRQLLKQRSETVTVPAATHRWATLAAELSDEDPVGERAGSELLRNVEKLLASGATGEALGWTEVASRLVPVVHGTFETSVLLANRRIEVEQRKQRMRNDLHRFLRREELVAAFDRLLDAPDDGGWALHYLGHGGVGKTTLLRYLAAELAPSRGRAVAWVDFDRLSPDFPATRPGQLLLDLLEDLEGYASGETSRSAYEQARAELRGLHWWVPGGTPKADKDRAVAAFCAFLESVDRPVVLVLDTCEELTKFQPQGVGVPQVDAAFDLVEQVHRSVESVRVVFAGRRPLAAQGADGWVVDEAKRPPYVPGLKDYLQVCEVAGFTEREATTYLTSVENLSLEPDDLARVLERCRAPFAWRFGRHHDADVPRYSPFDLSLSASDPHGDVFLETRVQRRLGERWSTLLPVVTVLRRFDRSMLGCAVDPIDLDDAWHELQATDWTSATLDRATESVFVEVDPGLLVRLDAHYAERDHRAELDSARARLAQPLADLLGGAWHDDPPLEAVEAAVRAAEPAAAAALMADLMLRVADQERWTWAFSVCGRLLGPDGALADPDHAAAPVARTLYGVAHARTASGADLTGHWHLVAARAGQHPDEQLARWLRVHALLLAEHGNADSLREAADLAAELLLGSDLPAHRAVWGIWLLGTCLTEVDELTGQTVPKSSHALLRLGRRFAEVGQRPLGALALVAAAELVPGQQSREVVTTALEWCDDPLPRDEAVRLVSADHPGIRSICHRVRLHALRRQPSNRGDLAWLDDCLRADPEDPDADRLAGLILGRWLDRTLVPGEVLARVTDHVGTAPPPPSAAVVHAGLPPLRVVLSRAWAALGEDGRARAAVGRPGWLVPGTPEQLALDVARVQVSRRFRMSEKDHRLRTSLRADHRPGEIPLVVEAAGLLTFLVPDLRGDYDPLDLHVLLRGSSDPDGPLDEAVARAAGQVPFPGAPGTTATTLDLQLDLVELSLAGRTTSPRDGLAGIPSAVLASLERADLMFEDRIALALRASALDQAPLAPADLDVPFTGGHGFATGHLIDAMESHPRLVAEIAMAEGELLALRLPLHAATLLDDAGRQYRKSQDPLGELMATVLAQLARRRGGRKADLAAIDRALTRAHELQPLLPRGLADLPVRDPHASRDPAVRWWEWLDRIELAVFGEQHAWSKPRGRPAATSPELRLQPNVPPLSVLEATPPQPTWGDAYRKVASSLPPAPGSWTPPPPQPISPASVADDYPGVAAPLRAPVLRSLPRLAARVAYVAAMTLIVLVAIAGLIGLVVLLYTGFTWVLQSLGIPGSGRALLTVPAFIVLLVLLIWAVGRFLLSGPGNNLLTVTLRESGGKLTVTADGWRQRKYPLPRRRAHTEFAMPLPGSTEPVLPPAAADDELLRLAHATRPLEVAIDASLRLTGTCWERVLGTWLEPLGPIRAHRVQSGGGHWRYVDQSGRVCLAAPPQWWPSLARAVARADGTREVVGPGLTADDLQAGDVVVVVGAVVGERAAGRIVVADQNGDDQVLEPDEFGRAAAVVVCALPAVGNAEVTDPARLRRCAADLVLTGCPTAVVLPALPPELLHRAVRLLLEGAAPGRIAFPGQLAFRVELVRELLVKQLPTAAVEVTELRAR